MAFVNTEGGLISFECSELIEELRGDIAEYGEELRVEVVTIEAHGVTIYRDYFPDFPGVPDFELDKLPLEEGESIIEMTAGELLRILEIQNGIF